MSAVEIDWVSLNHAFESGSAETHFYLDRQTGKTIAIARAGSSYAPTSSLASATLPECIQDDVGQAAQPREESSTRYVSVPQADTADEYRDMETFIPGVSDPKLASELWRAIRGTGAFRRFRDVLANHPAERQSWLTYKEVRMLLRINDWLSTIAIEPTNPRQPPLSASADRSDATDRDAERQELIEELAILLLYLCSWEEQVGPNMGARKAWKGFTFATLNSLEDRGLLHQSRKARSVTLTDEGIELARELELRFRP